MEDKKDNNRPEQRPIDPDKNNANQEKEYRKDKREGKIDEDIEDEIDDES
ncbi:hypothetical protein [Aequorivita lipolytica]|nr:hypothetical protein [Aequorivita lipolytica]SRX51333.1 hypothetical protein AEQU2_01813 [Aequorivita lipolytica]